MRLCRGCVVETVTVSNYENPNVVGHVAVMALATLACTSGASSTSGRRTLLLHSLKCDMAYLTGTGFVSMNSAFTSGKSFRCHSFAVARSDAAALAT